MKQISIQFEKPWKDKHKELVKRFEDKQTEKKKTK